MTEKPLLTGAADDRPLPFSQLVMRIVREHEGERITLGELAAGLRDRAWGGLLLIFAAINLLPLPPGTTTVTGLPLIVITAQLAAGRARPWFPRKVDQRGIATSHLDRVVTKVAPWERRIERIFRPRFVGLTSHRAARVIGVVGLILSVILWLPIPLGNHAPALALTLFALALIYRDGVLVVLGLLATIASFFLVSVTFAAAWWAAVKVWAAVFGAGA
jgi:hypothetical protein